MLFHKISTLFIQFGSLSKVAASSSLPFGASFLRHVTRLASISPTFQVKKITFVNTCSVYGSMRDEISSSQIDELKVVEIPDKLVWHSRSQFITRPFWLL